MRYAKPALVVSILIGLTLCMPAAALAQQADVSNGAATSGRILSTAAAAIGLVSAVAAGWALFRNRKGHINIPTFITCAVVGLLVIAYAAFHLAQFTGNLGTGDGRAGALLAIVFGSISLLLSIIALQRAPGTRR